MTAFRFQLQKVLDWRRTQLELEESRFRQAAEAVAELDRARAALSASGVRAETELRTHTSVAALELEALGEFRLHVQRREHVLATQRMERLRYLAEREKTMLEARRRCRLLERLRERRLAEWTRARDRELEELASESFLARWQREHPYNEVHDS
jgi:hypothetical protein